MNLAYRDIRHNLGRFALTCIGLGLLLGVVRSMIGIYRGVVSEALTLARAPAAQVWVVQAGTRGPFAEASRLPGDTREMIARVTGVARAGAVTYQTVETRAPSGRSLRLLVVGYEPRRPGGPVSIATGRALARSHYELVADAKTGLSPGDRVRLGRNTFTVVGCTTGQTSSNGDPCVFISLLDSQELQFELEPAVARREASRGGPLPPQDVINAVVAQLYAGASPRAIALAVKQWKHLGALTQQEQEDLLVHSVADRPRRQLGLFTVILITVSAVVIALIIYTLTLDKLREIATLKLIGAADRVIVSLILQQALAMGAIGYAAGVSLIHLTHDHFPRRVVLLPEDTAALGVLVVLVCVAASALGVRLALRVDPASALGG